MQYAHDLSFKETKTLFFNNNRHHHQSYDSQNLRGGLTVTQHISIIADFIRGLTLSEFRTSHKY